MPNEIIHSIAKLAGGYFSESHVRQIIDDLTSLEITEDCIFYQLSQEANEPKFEVVFWYKFSIVDYTFRPSRKDTVTVPIRSVSTVHLSETEKAMNLRINSNGDNYLVYSVTVETYRKSLKEFYKKLHHAVSLRDSK